MQGGKKVIGWFIAGGFFGLVLGYVMSALMNMSSRDMENENLMDYCIRLEDELEEKKKIINSLSK